MPMSWDRGSQLTITSVLVSRSTAVTMATEFANRFAWVICTALGVPVDPEVS